MTTGGGTGARTGEGAIVDAVGEVAALLTAAAGEHERAGRHGLAAAHLRRASGLSAPDAA